MKKKNISKIEDLNKSVNFSSSNLISPILTSLSDLLNQLRKNKNLYIQIQSSFFNELFSRSKKSRSNETINSPMTTELEELFNIATVCHESIKQSFKTLYEIICCFNSQLFPLAETFVSTLTPWIIHIFDINKHYTSLYAYKFQDLSLSKEQLSIICELDSNYRKLLFTPDSFFQIMLKVISTFTHSSSNLLKVFLEQIHSNIESKNDLNILNSIYFQYEDTAENEYFNSLQLEVLLSPLICSYLYCSERLNIFSQLILFSSHIENKSHSIFSNLTQLPHKNNASEEMNSVNTDSILQGIICFIAQSVSNQTVQSIINAYSFTPKMLSNLNLLDEVSGIYESFLKCLKSLVLSSHPLHPLTRNTVITFLNHTANYSSFVSLSLQVSIKELELILGHLFHPLSIPFNVDLHIVNKPNIYNVSYNKENKLDSQQTIELNIENDVLVEQSFISNDLDNTIKLSTNIENDVTSKEYTNDKPMSTSIVDIKTLNVDSDIDSIPEIIDSE